ncbi:MAG: VOC family protein [Bacteroidales bacterium]|nr:VOC family protein [Bacteroidales bacterium]
MLRHIGLQINEESEIKDFYEDILKFKEVNRFNLHPQTRKEVFNTEETILVVRMKQFDIMIELFICPEKRANNMSHLAFEFWKVSKILDKAKEKGYSIIEFEKPGGSTARYIKDKAGNLFEIKDINLI